ncbi:MAG: tripartite tricarboxylate transporter substrate-binding protein [Hyphomicrobiales bacterium]
MNHLDCVRFNAATGVNVTHVPYRGGGAAMQDLIAGRVDYICTLSAADSGTIVAPPERRSIEFLRQHVESEIERNAIPIRAIGLSIE